jgi:hypothetical protein
LRTAQQRNREAFRAFHASMGAGFRELFFLSLSG